MPPPGEDDMPYDRLLAAAPRVVVFAAVWVVIEWVRGWLFTGFAWNPMGTIWSETRTPFGLPIIQIAALIGELR